MKYLLFFLSLSTLSAFAAVSKLKPHSRKNPFHCRDNDYYCQAKLNEASSKNKQNASNTLSQFDSDMVQDVSKTLGQGLPNTLKK